MLTIPSMVMVLFRLICQLLVVGFVTQASKKAGLDEIIPTVYSITAKAIYNANFMYQWINFWSYSMYNMCIYEE
ncbi:hypothetical protein TVAG_251620 [Trichomonas vaginalis G3]|uniref:Secreted protein n=1 Tax=Trichomonas vaginalis (strain ATCC PRA-98 / G3) TaxID=412133 RepID=A2EF20_TRIV3|nr:hypothetical protein TVAGG3_0670310 [Trichomonas vaginalis G3]EAY08736.1 hypothetical protein TVAG_251620 [Trichomonas vaginalis G3]KAI5507145.1 hypothetical protein TVAGG3_0670310 [Trichomonas vaginalis G3]|eukprot:XP_001320959.1 hypothetical protein [Trichomonas vaginalis G3]